MSKPPDTLVGRTNSLKRKKTDDNVSPDTLRAEALSKSIDICTYYIDQDEIPKLDSHHDLVIIILIIFHGEITILTSLPKYTEL